MKEIKMLGEMIRVRAKVKTVAGFSAYADQQEILRWLSYFSRAPQKTFVVHGEPSASSALADLIRGKLQWPVKVARNGQKIILS